VRHPADGNNIIGHEYIDRDWYPPSVCPYPGYYCRWSDAAMFTYQALDALGRVAHPRYGTNALIAGARFPIVGTSSTYNPGAPIDKVGAYGGWQFGYIDEPCWDDLNFWDDPPADLICQVRASVTITGGDSGGPAFFWQDNDTIILAGVVVGSDPASITFGVISRFDQISYEIGDAAARSAECFDQRDGPRGTMRRAAQADTTRFGVVAIARLAARHHPVGPWAVLVLLAVTPACRHPAAQHTRVSTGETRTVTQVVAHELLPGVTASPSVRLDTAGRLMLRAAVNLRNTGRESVRLAVGGCPLEIRAYSGPGEEHRLVWSSWETRRACPALRRVLTLAPGDTGTLRTAFFVSAIRDRGAPPGRYAFTLIVRLIDPKVTTSEYPAGELALP
jgi:hypothetical protein